MSACSCLSYRIFIFYFFSSNVNGFLLINCVINLVVNGNFELSYFSLYLVTPQMYDCDAAELLRYFDISSILAGFMYYFHTQKTSSNVVKF